MNEFDKFLAEMLEDHEFKEEYDKLDSEFEMIQKGIDNNKNEI